MATSDYGPPVAPLAEALPSSAEVDNIAGALDPIPSPIKTTHLDALVVATHDAAAVLEDDAAVGERCKSD